MRLASKFWPQSLYWQLIAAVAIGVLFVQGISVVTGYYTQSQAAIAQAALTLRERVASTAGKLQDRNQPWDAALRSSRKRGNAQIAFTLASAQLDLPGYAKDTELTQAAQQLLQGAGGELSNITVSIGPATALPTALLEPLMQGRFVRRLYIKGEGVPANAVLISAQTDDGRWLSSASLVRPAGKWSLALLLLKTLGIFAAVMIPLALVARRIIKPLEQLTQRTARIGIGGEAAPLESKGPADIRNLINSFNGMQLRVISLLSEKDVMLGAIGHDLKTPLASLRVRVESVADEGERAKMAATIDEMATILDDILTLARLGKSGEALQRTDIGALLESVIDDFSGVNFEPAHPCIIANIRPILIRRALRNLIGNAIKHGGNAAVSAVQTNNQVCIYIDDDGPGIPAEDIDTMYAAFVRAETSRNRATGGSGLGLTIARAIARSHGGDITLANRTSGGLRATIILPDNAM